MRVLPTKHLQPERSLLHVGGEVLTRLGTAKTVSRLWEEVVKAQRAGGRTVTFDWFVLALDLLYTASAIDIVDGRISRRSP
jgi:hypothetical protein